MYACEHAVFIAVPFYTTQENTFWGAINQKGTPNPAPRFKDRPGIWPLCSAGVSAGTVVTYSPLSTATRVRYPASTCETVLWSPCLTGWFPLATLVSPQTNTKWKLIPTRTKIGRALSLIRQTEWRHDVVGRASGSSLGSREFETHQRIPVVSFSKRLYPHCLVLVGFRNGFERDLLTRHCLYYSRIKINEFKLKRQT